MILRKIQWYLYHFHIIEAAPVRSRGRGGRGGDRGSRPGRGRPFDRQSQTGKMSVDLTFFSFLYSYIALPSDTDKKVSQGWGDNDGEKELKAEEGGSLDAVAEATKPDSNWTNSAVESDWAAAVPTASTEEVETKDVDNAGEGVNRRPPREEQDDNTLTLEQYLAQQKEKQSELPRLEDIRLADDSSEWKDVVPLNKVEGDSYFVGRVSICVIYSKLNGLIIIGFVFVAPCNTRYGIASLLVGFASSICTPYLYQSLKILLAL